MKKTIIIIAVVAWLCCLPLFGVTVWFASTAVIFALISVGAAVYGFILSSAAAALYKDEDRLTVFDRIALRLSEIIVKENNYDL